eukprot:scaffold4.g4588.t1
MTMQTLRVSAQGAPRARSQERGRSAKPGPRRRAQPPPSAVSTTAARPSRQMATGDAAGRTSQPTSPSFIDMTAPRDQSLMEILWMERLSSSGRAEGEGGGAVRRTGRHGLARLPRAPPHAVAGNRPRASGNSCPRPIPPLSSNAASPRQIEIVEDLRQAAVQDALACNPWAPKPHHLSLPALWERMREEAHALAAQEPAVASKMHLTLLMHSGLDRALAFLLGNKLASQTLMATQMVRLVLEAYEDEPELIEAAAADLQAVKDRDPACESFLHCMLFFKGFQARRCRRCSPVQMTGAPLPGVEPCAYDWFTTAWGAFYMRPHALCRAIVALPRRQLLVALLAIQAQRVANWLWRNDRRTLALALQSRISEAFNMDLHPGATIGRGVMMDHGTGIVVGETVRIGDNVSMLHHVTLGGSGTGYGSHHPVIGNGVLLGAGVSVLGPVVVGAASKIGAGSVVVTSLPSHVVAVGVPAKVVKRLADFEQPVSGWERDLAGVEEMDQVSGYIQDWVI